MLLPYAAWGAELSRDYHERSRITGRARGLRDRRHPARRGPAGAARHHGGRAAGAILAALVLEHAAGAAASAAGAPAAGAGERSGRARRARLAPAASRSPGATGRSAGCSRRIFLNGIANGLPATLFLLFVADRLQAEGSGRAAAAALLPRRHRRDPVLAAAQLPHRQAPRLGRVDAVGLRPPSSGSR